MSLSRRLSRLEKQATNPPDAIEVSGDDWAGRSLDRPADDAMELARATAATFGHLVGQYREYYKLSAGAGRCPSGRAGEPGA
jgi:hypothetical protein